jgi:adenylate cyclase class IV
VVGLGEFVELEVVLRADQTAAAGAAIARDLMERLDIAESQLVEQAYVDLLAPGR